jgi:hypothetical protein
MAELMLGKLSPQSAIRSRAVQLAGSRSLVKSFAAWYPRSFEFEGKGA